MDVNKYISVVFYSRNDNHGSNMSERMNMSINSFITLFEKYKVPAEIILVDYNPPEDTAPLSSVLSVDAELENVSIRHITVPPEIHKQYKDSDKLPMNNMVARNVGVRRASGEFILCTCIDIILSEPLAEYISNRNLERGRSYRLDRIDVNRNILERKTTIDEQLDFCEKNIIDIHIDTNFKDIFPGTNVSYLHTNMSGDFQLLHKDHWHGLHGYMEYDLMGTHADSIFCYMAELHGAKEIILEDPYRIYHIDHDSRWLWPVYTHVLRNWRMLSFKLSREQVKDAKADYYKLAMKMQDKYGEESTLDKIGVGLMTKEEYHGIIRDMILGKRSIVYSGDNWGLGDTELHEERVNC